MSRSSRWEENRTRCTHNRHRLIFKEFTDPDLHISLGSFQVERLKGGDMYTGVYSGFTEFDDGLLSLFSTFVTAKFAQVREKLLSQEKSEQLMGIVKTMIALLGQRSYMALIMELRDLMPALVGYEHFGIYFHNKACKVYNHIVANELCTCFQSHYKAGMRNLIKYPDDTGITGMVFKEDTHVISLKGKREKNFHELDNIEAYGEIKDFLFMPTYGYNGTKNGVMQLYNKRQGKPDEVEVKRLENYQKLLGVMMENVVDFDKAIDIEMNVMNILSYLDKTATLFKKEESRYTSTIDDIKIAVQNLQYLVRENEMRKEQIKAKSANYYIQA
eukprot:TRINITY_DN8153_c0_g1_i2.p1 TRINITY_DN8153_c0_g1~~TRINITY_DN8153_c0_g1_i2.p1  ORF type:complete len:330 (+),score=91.02 TRINITY_DN8153_c0_g1_i2:309-1298(+)